MLVLDEIYIQPTKILTELRIIFINTYSMPLIKGTSIRSQFIPD